MVNPVRSPGFGAYPQGPGLNAGQLLNVAGPKGARQVLQRYPGGYFEQFASGTLVQYLEPGTYTVNNGSGGSDVGPFKATLTVPAELTATVQQSAAGATVNWRGGDPAAYVVIQGSVPAPGSRVSFSCTERAGAGQFTVPGWVLASLGAAPDISVVMATGSSPQNRFQAPGLDLGFFNFCSASTTPCGLFLDYYY
jgi:hypothetical protein